MPTPAELEALSLEDLRKLAIAEQDGQLPSLLDGAPPLGETEKPKRFRRQIDLGDGSGIQEFEGATMDELLDKLTTAQANATKKIREQNQILKDLFPDGVPKVEAEPVFKTLEEKIDYLLNKQRANQVDINWRGITDTFVALHPEYEGTPKNGRKLLKYMKAEGYAQTLEGLERAYKELTDDGLLSIIPDQNEDVLQAEQEEQQRRIAEAGKTTSPNATPRRRVTSGLSVRNNARPTTQVPTEDLYKMPLDELKKKAFAQIRGRQ